MRYIYVFFLLFFLGNAFSQESYYPKYDSLKREYKIISIKKSNTAYLINIEDSSDYRFTVISIKYKGRKGTKIEIGEKYDLLFYSIYPPPEEDVTLIGGNIINHDFFINGTRIKFQGNFDTGILVTTPNLKGLYYIKSE